MYKVFIGSSTEGLEYAKAVESILNKNSMFKVVAWWDVENQRLGLSYFEILFSILSDVSFAIFVSTPDDVLMKRKSLKKVIRDNVLFEYGLFAGYLGRSNALIIQIGDSELPTDLDGINMIKLKSTKETTPKKLKTQLISAVNQCTKEFLYHCKSDDFITAISDIREIKVEMLDDVKDLLTKSLFRQRPDFTAHLSTNELIDLLFEYKQDGERIVGKKGHESVVKNYIDFKDISGKHLNQLVSTFMFFANSKLFNEEKQKANVSRIAICNHCDTNILGEIVTRLKMKPAIVSFGAESDEKIIQGRCLQGETVAYFHDFIKSAFLPYECVGLLNNHGANVKQVYTFFIQEKVLKQVKDHFQSCGIEFFYFCMQKDSIDNNNEIVIEMTEEIK